MLRPAPFTALKWRRDWHRSWRRGRTARTLRHYAKDFALIMVAGVLMLAFAHFGSLS